MKTKRILSFICVLSLALSLCSVFSFAVAPEAETEVTEAGDNARSPYYCYVKTSTYLYKYSTGATSVKELNVGDQLEILSGHTTTRLYVRTMDYKYGYVLRSCVVETG